MKNKKTIMFVSALMIVVYHLWISVFPRTSTAFQIEQFARFAFFVGVDLFFFISAYSQANRDTTNYGHFIWSRFKTIYIKYIIFAVFACLLQKWPVARLVKVICGIDLFERGGGSFLWFAPSIMIVYLLLPLYKKVDEKFKVGTPVLAVLLWCAIGFLITKFSSYNKIFIFYNRIPIILLGFYACKYKVFEQLKKHRAANLLLGFILLVGGAFLLHRIGYRPPLNKPFHEFFYVVGIPLILGLAIVLDLIPGGKLVRLVGSCTFELYALQMIVGYSLTDFIYKKTQNILATNILALLLIIVISVLVSKLFAVTLLRKKA